MLRFESNNLRSRLENAILLLFCCFWTPYVMWGHSFVQEAIALSVTGCALTWILKVFRKGELPFSWPNIVRPTTLDAGLLYGTSLVSLNFVSHMLHNPDPLLVLNFWCSIANSLNVALLLLQPHNGVVDVVVRVMVSWITIMGFCTHHHPLYLLTSLCMFELCLFLVQSGLPRSFTLGEALVVIQLVSLSTTDFLYAGMSSSSRSSVLICIQGGLLGTIWLCAILIPLFRVKENTTSPLVFFPLSLSFLVGPVAFWVGMRIDENPIWFVQRLTFSNTNHVLLLAYWMTCLALALPLIHFSVSRFPLVVIRKLYHLLALVMFAPAIHFTPEFLSLGFAIALALGLYLEYIRALNVYPLGALLEKYLRKYTDERDDGLFILTHLYLLFGCALSTTFMDVNNKLSMYAGVLILGAGDAAAAIVGSQYGTRKWPGGGNKTVEGTLSGIVAMALVGECILFVENETELRFVLYLACLVSLLLEAFTSQIDNLVLPLFFWSALKVY